MPNHIQNRLFVDGLPADAAALMGHIRVTYPANEHRPEIRARMDFEKITPMPESLGTVEVVGRAEEIATLMFKGIPLGFAESVVLGSSARDITDRERTAAKQMYDNLKVHGAMSWYDWSRVHWGTKWNAYATPDSRDTEDTIYFQTAWSAPIGLMTKLSTMFPAVTLFFDYADEDKGCNLGSLRIHNGETIRLRDFGLNYSPEALRFALQLHYPEMTAEELREYGYDENFQPIPEGDDEEVQP